jgi:hypothetical protein
MHSFCTLLSIAFLSARIAQATNICGLNGRNTTIESYKSLSGSAFSNSLGCSTKCSQSARCKSFSVGKTTCYLFPVAVAGNFEPDSTSPYVFYDAGCLSMLSTSTINYRTGSASRKSTVPSESKTALLTSSASFIPASSSASAAVSTPTVIPPVGCPLPATHQMTTFFWYNSTHNLDCVTGPDIGDGTGCYNASDAPGAPSGLAVCDPRQGPCGLCGIPLCETGLPLDGVLGYGPADYVNIAIDNGTLCSEHNPQSIRRWEVGDGVVLCGGPQDIIEFYGSSNDAVNGGTVRYNQPATECDDGKIIYATYIADFTVNCSHDSGRNATCGTTLPVMLHLASFSMS